MGPRLYFLLVMKFDKKIKFGSKPLQRRLGQHTQLNHASAKDSA